MEQSCIHIFVSYPKKQRAGKNPSSHFYSCYHMVFPPPVAAGVCDGAGLVCCAGGVEGCCEGEVDGDDGLRCVPSLERVSLLVPDFLFVVLLFVREEEVDGFL